MDVVKTIFKEALYREDLEKDPTSKIGNIKEERRPPDIFSLEEFQLLSSMLPTVGAVEVVAVCVQGNTRRYLKIARPRKSLGNTWAILG